MSLSDTIEEYIQEFFEDETSVELRRGELAIKFNCVPSQINYVIATRFIPQLGFYVESRRGGGGYIRISRIDLSESEYICDILNNIEYKLSQSLLDIYLKDFVKYNVIDIKTAKIVKVMLSEKSLQKIEKNNRDEIRADMFKNLIINLI